MTADGSVPFPDPFLIGVLALGFFAIGLCMGSFASAVSYRACRGQSWIFSEGDEKRAARSACPLCGHRLSVFDLVPVLSWVFLKGRCRYCAGKISPVYPLTELVAGIVMGSYFLLCSGVWSGADFVFLKSFLFAVLLPFPIAVLSSFFTKQPECPRSFLIVGLLSLSGMVILSLV